ncbi:MULTISPECIES: acyl-CoA thioesterase [Streptomyces]|uniref:Acyl-CoA thioester hydrolase n=2 Tax=Streptomyces TaxID=1883 RepID=A0A514K097_9ACTN|nr:thioesterase family protein [Streptomyces calvus]MYS30007.1 acyl-CoA thioesterase [Streptomyces sp. SID7804]MBA8947506.1 acyl-CoA thioester hydrolase [Streptomyces calvus]MBA8973852.1 acyl-CoA thioester hydrolase [Streptomyces calvus]QDI72188.1 thioesterase [Streptomyces calvus]GGP78189.1 thioesterase [Streptomyces calvus]
MTAEAPLAPALSYGRLIPVTVHFDDLDALGLLHNARYPLLVERAWTELWQDKGVRFEGDWAAAGDACNAVKEFRIGYEAPVTRPGGYAVHLWLDRLGTTGLTYGFRFCSADGTVTYARGSRVLVRLDAATLRPAPWSEEFRAAGRELLRPDA